MQLLRAQLTVESCIALGVTETEVASRLLKISDFQQPARHNAQEKKSINKVQHWLPDVRTGVHCLKVYSYETSERAVNG